ncbi:hypothetical protein [Colwellia sp. MEBiC06753]
MTCGSQLSIEKDLHPEYLYAKLVGTASTIDIKTFYNELFSVAEGEKLNKLMIDATELQLDYGSSEIVQVIKSIMNKLANFKVARIVSHSGHKQLLIQQFAENESLPVKNFNCYDSALNWLIDE